MKNKKFKWMSFKWLSLGSILLLFVVILSQTQPKATGNDKNEIIQVTVVGPRSLREALQILEQQLDCVITYEDPKYKHPDMVQEVFPGSPVLPRIRFVSFTYNLTNKDEPLKVIQALLERYHQQDDTVKFEVLRSKVSQRIFNVFPISEKNEAGELVATNKFLDTKVSVSTTATYVDLVAEICKKISKTRDKGIVAGRPPTWTFAKKKVLLKIDHLSALAGMNALFNNYNSKEQESLSWDLSIDPQFDPAVINFHRIIPIKNLQSLTSLSVETPRPLADASKVLEGQVGNIIIYEDPLYLCSCQVWRNKAGEVQAPSGGNFNFSYSAQTKPSQVLDDSLKAFNNHNIGKFVVRQIDDVFYVHPTEFMGEDEKVLPLEPVLETPISLPANQKPASEILKTFCQSLSTKTKWKVTLGQLPPLPAFDKALTLEPAEKPAVEYLVELSKKMGGNISWQLLYEPRMKGYVLNAHVVQSQKSPQDPKTTL